MEDKEVEPELLTCIAACRVYHLVFPSLQVPGELLDEAMERMILTDPLSADSLLWRRCAVPG